MEPVLWEHEAEDSSHISRAMRKIRSALMRQGIKGNDLIVNLVSAELHWIRMTREERAKNPENTEP